MISGADAGTIAVPARAHMTSSTGAKLVTPAKLVSNRDLEASKGSGVVAPTSLVINRDLEASVMRRPHRYGPRFFILLGLLLGCVALVVFSVYAFVRY